jgi:hypothetical protein
MVICTHVIINLSLQNVTLTPSVKIGILMKQDNKFNGDYSAWATQFMWREFEPYLA